MTKCQLTSGSSPSNLPPCVWTSPFLLVGVTGQNNGFLMAVSFRRPPHPKTCVSCRWVCQCDQAHRCRPRPPGRQPGQEEHAVLRESFFCVHQHPSCFPLNCRLAVRSPSQPYNRSPFFHQRSLFHDRRFHSSQQEKHRCNINDGSATFRQASKSCKCNTSVRPTKWNGMQPLLILLVTPVLPLENYGSC